MESRGEPEIRALPFQRPEMLQQGVRGLKVHLLETEGMKEAWNDDVSPFLSLAKGTDTVPGARGGEELLLLGVSRSC